jgi:hypothetical protein
VIQGKDGIGVLLDEGVISCVTLCRSGPSRIPRIEVPSDELLSTLVGDLAHEVVIITVGRPQECRSDTEQTLEGLFNQIELVVDLIKGESSEIFMVPGVRGDHMSLSVGVLHTFNVDRVVNATV